MVQGGVQESPAEPAPARSSTGRGIQSRERVPLLRCGNSCQLLQRPRRHARPSFEFRGSRRIFQTSLGLEARASRHRPQLGPRCLSRRTLLRSHPAARAPPRRFPGRQLCPPASRVELFPERQFCQDRRSSPAFPEGAAERSGPAPCLGHRPYSNPAVRAGRANLPRLT